MVFSVLDVISEFTEELDNLSNGISGGVGGELEERLDHGAIGIEFGEMGQRLYFFSDFFDFAFELDPRTTHLKIVNNSEGFAKGINSFLVFSLTNSVVSSLLSSESSTFFNRGGKESDVFDGRFEFSFGVSEELLGVSDSLFTFSLRSGVRISLVGRVGDFSVTSNNIFIMLNISSGLFRVKTGDKFVNKSDNVINNTFGSEVNL